MYVLPAPVMAAPLPPGLCPQGDSMSIGILWNMFSYSRSSTRTEMECLDKVLASVRALPSTAVIQAPAIPSSASTAPSAAAAPASAASAAEVSPPVKKPEVRKVAPRKAQPKASSAPSCEEAARKACQSAKKT